LAWTLMPDTKITPIAQVFTLLILRAFNRKLSQSSGRFENFLDVAGEFECTDCYLTHACSISRESKSRSW
jgi:hypothetical protein